MRGSGRQRSLSDVVAIQARSWAGRVAPARLGGSAVMGWILPPPGWGFWVLKDRDDDRMLPAYRRRVCGQL